MSHLTLNDGQNSIQNQWIQPSALSPSTGLRRMTTFMRPKKWKTKIIKFEVLNLQKNFAFKYHKIGNQAYKEILFSKSKFNNNTFQILKVLVQSLIYANSYLYRLGNYSFSRHEFSEPSKNFRDLWSLEFLWFWPTLINYKIFSKDYFFYMSLEEFDSECPIPISSED